MRDDWWGSMSCTEKLHHIGDGSERLSSPVRGWACYSFSEMAGSEVRGAKGGTTWEGFQRTQNTGFIDVDWWGDRVGGNRWLRELWVLGQHLFTNLRGS